MFRLHGFFTQNTLKTLYVLEEIGAEYEYRFVNLFKGENRTEAFRAITPVGKVPVLEYDGFYLFESGTICRFVAGEQQSPLYPADRRQRAVVDQWMTFFSSHPGQWLSNLYYEKVIKPAAGIGETDEPSCEKSRRLVTSGLKAVERGLEQSDWLANDTFSIVEPYALAYLEQAPAVGFDLSPFPRVSDWYERISAREAVASVRDMVRPYREAVLG